MKRRVAAVLFGTCLVLALMAAAELLLPYSGPRGRYTRYDRETRWSLRPGYTGIGPNLPDVPLTYDIRINEQGFRGGPLTVPKPADVIRIAALGDSVTFGFGVAEQDTFLATVAALLAPAAPPKRLEWVNAGVPAFSSHQGLRHLDARVLPIAPDIVIVLFGWNDGWRAATPDSAWKAGHLEALIQSSRLVAFARRGLGSLLDRVGSRPDSVSGTLVPRVPVQDFERNLREIIAHIGRANAHPVLMTAPAAFGPDRPPESYFRQQWTVPRAELEPMRLRYAEAARRVAAATGTALVDCARLVPSDPRLFLADGYHPNKAGFDLIAQAIAEVIHQNRWLPAEAR